MIRQLVWIGAGGCVGAILRYVVSGWVQTASRNFDFPYGTLAVNLIGCGVIGFLSAGDILRGILSPQARLFLLIGLLGAFTTYSTFGNESLTLITDGKFGASLAYIGLHLVLGLGFVWLGHAAALLIWR